jgi:hypothetical protein
VWDPRFFVRQVPAFVQPVAAPAAAPCDAPRACFEINVDYIPLMAGALTQLVQPTTWTAVDQVDLDRILSNMTQVVEIVGTAVQCNTVPAIGPGGSQQACNIAGYMAQMVIRQSMARAIADIQSGYDVLNYASFIFQFIPGLPLIFGQALTVLEQLYTTISGGNLSDFQTGAADDTLWGLVSCAIFSAIEPDGQVTAANYPTLLNNICTVPYTLTDVTDAICSYATNLGLSGWVGLQPQGVIAQYDCTNCGATGPFLGPTGPQPRQISGEDIVTIGVGLAEAILPIAFPQPFPTPPLLTTGTDSDQVVASIENTTTTGTTLRITAAAPVTADQIVNVQYRATDKQNI